MWVPGEAVSQVMSIRGVGEGEKHVQGRRLSHSGPSTPATFFPPRMVVTWGIKAAVVEWGPRHVWDGGQSGLSPPQEVWAVASQGPFILFPSL